MFLLVYSHFVSISCIDNKVLFCYVHFSYRDGEGADCCCKLPQNRTDVSKDGKEGNLGGANFTRLLNQVTKNSAREDQCIDAVQVISDDKNSVVCYGFRHNDRSNSQRQYHQVHYEIDKIQSVPQVPEKKKFSFLSIYSIMNLFNQSFCGPNISDRQPLSIYLFTYLLQIDYPQKISPNLTTFIFLLISPQVFTSVFQASSHLKEG